MKRIAHRIPIDLGNYGRQPFIKIFFDVYDFYYALIDTGSENSFIDSSVYKFNNTDIKPLTVSGVAGKETINASVETVHMLTTDKQKRIIEFVARMKVVKDWDVFSKLDDKVPTSKCCMILGCDNLGNATIDLDKKELVLYEEYNDSDE